MKRLAAVLALLLLTAPVRAEIATYTIVDSDAAMVDHWPGLDGWIGTGDDLVSGAPSTIHGSAPNGAGSYSYCALDWLWDGTTEDGMPYGMSAMTFVSGTVDIDLDVAHSDIPVASSIVTDLNLTAGTEPFPGHGPFAASFSGIRTASYNPATGGFVFYCTLNATIMGGEDFAENQGVGGAAWVIDETDFESDIYEPYLGSHVVPLALARGASSVVYLLATGTVQPADGGTWGSMQFWSVIIGLRYGTSTEDSSFGAIKALY